MGILNWVLSKALGVPSAGEVCDKKVADFILANSVSASNIKMYRAERSDLNPNFVNRYYVGDARIGNSERGIFIHIDEYLAHPSGYYCTNLLALHRDHVYRKFLFEAKGGTYAWPLSCYFSDELTGGRFDLV